MPKQIIEDIINDTFKGETRKNALDFVAFLRENKMSPLNTSNNGWKVSSKACVVCYIWIDSEAGTFSLNPFIGEYAPNSLSDELKEIVWANKRSTCQPCHVIIGDGYNCSYKLNTVFGKDFSDACARSIGFKNPDAKEYECLKALILMRKNTIKNGTKMPNAPTNYV